MKKIIVFFFLEKSPKCSTQLVRSVLLTSAPTCLFNIIYASSLLYWGLCCPVSTTDKAYCQPQPQYQLHPTGSEWPPTPVFTITQLQVMFAKACSLPSAVTCSLCSCGIPGIEILTLFFIGVLYLLVHLNHAWAGGKFLLHCKKQLQAINFDCKQ